MMEWLNNAIAQDMQLSKQSAEKTLVVFSVMAPHLASELIERILNKQLTDCSWSYFDPTYTYKDKVTIVVQVNGKMRANIEVMKGAQQEDIETLAQDEIRRWLEGKEMVKVIFVKDRLINFVVKDR